MLFYGQSELYVSSFPWRALRLTAVGKQACYLR